MIFVKLAGGLGNQLFQYATGRRLAWYVKSELKLDVSGYTEDPLREYELGAFNIAENFASDVDSEALTLPRNNRFSGKLQRLFRIPQKIPSSYVRETYFHFDPQILSLPDNVYLDGYWQSEKYFIDIRDILLNEFTVKTSFQGQNRETAKIIQSCNSVSIHIRRGDYISDPKINDRYGSCELAYYNQCIAHLVEFVKKPHFFVFSDDIAWAKEHFKTPYSTTFVGHNVLKKSYEDLRLMSLCNHNIIANSSFSWWGAWLNINPDKMVYAPKKWLKDTSAAKDYSSFIQNLLPSKWIKI